MNLNKIAFSSDFRYEYIFLKGSISFVTSGGTPNTATITITHNLGYVPFFRLLIQFPSDNNYYGIFNGPNLLLGNWEINSVNATTSAIIVSLNNLTTSSLIGKIFYRIYAEPQT